MTNHYKITRILHQHRALLERLKPCMNYYECNKIKVDGNWTEYKNLCYNDLQRLSTSICPKCFDKIKREVESRIEREIEDIEW